MSVLHYIRHRAGMSKKDLATKLQVSLSDVSMMEVSGDVSEEIARKLSPVFGVPWQVFHKDNNNPLPSSVGVPEALFIDPAPSQGKLCGEYVLMAFDDTARREMPLYSFHITEDGRFIQLACEFVDDGSVFGKKSAVAFAARGYVKNDRTFVYEQYCDLTSIMPDKDELFGVVGYLTWKDWPRDAAMRSVLACARVFSIDCTDVATADRTCTFAPPKEGPYTSFLVNIACKDPLNKYSLERVEFTLRGYSRNMINMHDDLLMRNPNFADRKILISENEIYLNGNN